MTLRRVTLFILILALLLGCAALPAGAEHKHTWKDLPDGVIQQPTCTDNGWKIQYCTGCGITKDVKIPALGHSFTTKTYKSYADCEHYGIFYWTCSRCGYKSEGNDRPLGHDWDEGVVTTPPSGFTPGVKTYTCRRDPSHTYTEEVDPIPWLFEELEGINDPDFTGNVQTMDIGEPLFIVQQPEGGFISFDGDDFVTISVQVGGGETPYTYEWHMVDHTYDSTINDAALVAGVIDTDKLSDWSSHWGAILGGLDLDLSSVKIPAVDVTSKIVGTDSPVLYADKGTCEYWCRITDRAGQYIDTNSAYVNYKVHIIKQPQNVNLTGVETAELTCEAAGGRAENGITYTWYDKYGTAVGTGPVFDWDLEGEYWCEATDGVDTACSDPAVLYTADRLRIRFASAGGSKYWPEEKGELYAIVSGGVPPYEAKWEGDDSELPIYETETVGKYTLFKALSPSAGSYTFTVVDSMEAHADKTVTRRDRQLIITKQPEGGVIPTGSKLPLSVEIDAEDVQLPVTFASYKNGELYVDRTADEYSNTFAMHEPGIYHYVITDALGHSATSGYAVLKAEEFHVVDQTQSAQLKTATDKATLSVEVTGGTPPYSYQWRVNLLGKWVPTETKDPSKTVSAMGTYACRIMDADERCIWSEPIDVTYTGEEPLILLQPRTQVVKAGESSRFKYDFTLYCHAISGTGDNSGIFYAWYYWEKSHLISSFGEWKPIDVEKKGKTDCYRLGYYKCVVWDSLTGKSTCSDIVTAYEPFTCDIHWQEISSEYMFGKLSAKGGIGPYTIKLYTSWPSVTNDDWEVLLYESCVRDSIAEVDGWPTWVEGVGKYRDSKNKDGEVTLSTFWPVYQVVVTDGAGAEYTSDWISIWDLRDHDY